jgi:hypothetical protein
MAFSGYREGFFKKRTKKKKEQSKHSTGRKERQKGRR